MDDALKTESEKLTRSWMQHEAAKLREYLVAGVEDPRVNLQSILSRHFLLRGLFGDTFEPLMKAEYCFSAAMNWLLRLGARTRDPEELDAVLYALNRGADNAEGIEIPHYIMQVFAALPARAGELTVPNYIDAFLTQAKRATATASAGQPSLDAFCNLWQRVLLGRSAADKDHGSSPAASLSSFTLESSSLTRAFEPACGSANDYRFLHAYGLARFLNYTGLDLCPRNVENARALFPGIRFVLGNVFELPAPDQAFDFSFAHDLFEHLSLAGLEVAVKEICRVTSRGISVGFFNMDEIRDHTVRPLDEYHWNTLSMGRMKELFAQHGFSARVWHIGTFLRQQLGCDETHNPNAYTFFLSRSQNKGPR